MQFEIQRKYNSERLIATRIFSCGSSFCPLGKDIGEGKVLNIILRFIHAILSNPKTNIISKFLHQVTPTTQKNK